jgi:preprotein translocase subunit YajC
MSSIQDSGVNDSDIIGVQGLQETAVVPTESQQAPSVASGWTSLIPMVLIFAVFYFLLLRPQEKRRREKEKLVSDLKKGEEVLTSSGIYGIVHKVNEADNNVEIEISKDVRIKVLKSAIMDITSRPKAPITPKKNKK